MPEGPAKSRRRGWILAGTLAILVLASISSFLLIQYVNRSTPDKTLDAFCRDLLQADYRSAYDRFSAKLRRVVSEEAFAALLSQDRVTACTYRITGNLGDSVVSQLKLVHASRGSNTDIVTLIKESDGTWTVDDISRLSPVAARRLGNM